MRISDWSSDVCSSDLAVAQGRGGRSEPRGAGDEAPAAAAAAGGDARGRSAAHGAGPAGARRLRAREPAGAARQDRKSVVWGKSVSVRVDLGGRRIIKQKKKKTEA